jgi:hypothetical protein
VPVGVVLGTSTTTATPAMQVNGCCKADVMASTFQQYRVVGWGYKIRAITSVNQTSGRVQVASIPAPRFLPDMAFFVNTSTGRVNNQSLGFAYPMYDFYTALVGNFNANTNRTDIINNYLLPASGAALPQSFAGNLLDYPINVEVTSLQLASAPLRGHGKLTTREFEVFRESQSYLGAEAVAIGTGNTVSTDVLFYDSWQYQSGSSTGSGSNANTAAFRGLSSNSMLGWNAVLVSVLGAQAATTAFEIEVIYHVEGINPLSIAGSPLGGKASHHNPIEAMAAETINGASGKLPLLPFFPCSFSNSPPSSLDTLLGEHFLLGEYILPSGANTVEGNTIHMAAKPAHRQHDKRDGLGNIHAFGDDGGRQAVADGRRLSGIHHG